MPEDHPAKVRVIPPLDPLTDERFEAWMDLAFSPASMNQTHLQLNMVDFQRILLALDAERTRVGQLRHWLAHAGANMKKPEMELKVLMTAVEAALLADDPHGILNEAVQEISLSMAGKLDLDVSKWVQRQIDGVNDLKVGGMKPFGRVPSIESMKGTAVVGPQLPGGPQPRCARCGMAQDAPVHDLTAIDHPVHKFDPQDQEG